MNKSFTKVYMWNWKCYYQKDVTSNFREWECVFVIEERERERANLNGEKSFTKVYKCVTNKNVTSDFREIKSESVCVFVIEEREREKSREKYFEKGNNLLRKYICESESVTFDIREWVCVCDGREREKEQKKNNLNGEKIFYKSI